ncbi:excinuclease ABC subunit UvrC [Ureaplasma ceti]|uniref:UvrABC system protein C n=1 Tax=Ureaplasma ceti TaxID=3119530 RepID=A0ABP9U706_9BACT
MKNAYLKEKMALIPKKPGCYLWKNQAGKVIYVGKAKNLFNRTHQYFDKNVNYKTSKLVNEIADLDYIVVNNNNESLVLENNLIKKYWPKYNILLKDSSEYPYILITDEEHPRILYTRHYGTIKGKYYGPLADASFNRYELYKMLNEISPFKKQGPLYNQSSLYTEVYKLKNNLDDESVNIQALYKEWKKYIDDLFNGKSDSLVAIMREREEKSVLRLDFEEANRYKELGEALTKLSKSQIVQLASNKHTDYVAYYKNEDYLSINIFSYIDGKLLTKHNSIHQIYSELEEEVCIFLNQYYSNNVVPPKVVVSLDNEDLMNLSEIYNTKFESPNQTSDAEVLKMALLNAQDYLKNHFLITKKKEERTILAAEKLAELVNIPSARHIELFDNSNINLQDPVSGMVVFIDGQANKRLYRKYRLISDDNDSDYHFMKQVIYRRYSNLLRTGGEMPDLIIVDGGIMQIHAALESLTKLNLDTTLNIIGLKKDNQHKTDAIVLRNGEEIKLDKKSPFYFMLLNMQEEVHNYAISFFRKEHIRNAFKTFFDDIPGLGPVRRKKLLEHYPTMSDIEKAELHELAQIIPLKLAELIKQKLNFEKDNHA